MESTFRLGRIAGVRVGVHWSVVVVAALLAWSLALVTLPEAVEERAVAAYWAVGAATAVAFLASVLAHELSHAALARRNGVEVEDITIWLLGGIARLKGAATTPRAELRIALAGPVMSATIAVVALGFAAIVEAAGGDELARVALVWLGTVNIVLLVFNLIPAAPLDGGRVLSAVLWSWRGDEAWAHRSAAVVGRWFGSVLVALGLLVIVSGDALGGVWLAFIGWFLVNVARAEETGAVVRTAVEGVWARDVMSPDPVVASGFLTVEAFIDEVVQRWPFGAFPVVDQGGQVIGVIGLRTVRGVPRREWDRRRVIDVATPLSEVAQVSPSDALSDVVAGMRSGGEGRVLVLDEGRLVGIVSPTDIARLIERSQLTGGSRRRRARDAHVV